MTSKGRKKIAMLLTCWIPSARYRRLVRRAITDAPKAGPVVKGAYAPAGTGRYSTLVVPRGFGHSGSGVIGDLLSEYDGTTVFGGADPDGSGRFAGVGQVNAESFEVDLFKMRGGVADLASAFGESRAWGKFKLLDFVHVVEALYREPNIPIYDRAFLERSRRFVADLTTASWRSVTPLAESRFFEMPVPPPDEDRGLLNPLYAWRENLAESYVMKDLTTDEYVALAHDYLRDVLGRIPSRPVLVMDQLLSIDLPLDLCERYVGPFKMVAVWRDPRDVFCTGLAHRMPWIPNEPKTFVAWYRSLGIAPLRAADDPRLLVLRFEDLVLKYDESVARVEAFVGLKPEAHLRPRTAYDPSRSAKNIGIWRSCPDQAAMALIARELPEFCFEENCHG